MVNVEYVSQPLCSVCGGPLVWKVLIAYWTSQPLCSVCGDPSVWQLWQLRIEDGVGQCYSEDCLAVAFSQVQYTVSIMVTMVIISALLILPNIASGARWLQGWAKLILLRESSLIWGFLTWKDSNAYLIRFHILFIQSPICLFRSVRLIPCRRKKVIPACLLSLWWLFGLTTTRLKMESGNVTDEAYSAEVIFFRDHQAYLIFVSFGSLILGIPLAWNVLWHLKERFSVQSQIWSKFAVTVITWCSSWITAIMPFR